VLGFCAMGVGPSGSTTRVSYVSVELLSAG
jgi:hypothetical protein